LRTQVVEQIGHVVENNSTGLQDIAFACDRERSLRILLDE
jgi:hypothetical protein